MSKQKRMIITGVSSGIGLAIATEALRLGWYVDGIGRNAPALLAEHARGSFTACDLSDRAALKGISLATEEVYDCTVLVNNAGIAGPTGAIEDIESSKWRDTVDVNLNGQFYCTKYAMPLLKRSQNASIICISSVAGRLGYGYRTPYSATKWAIIGLVKSLAIELGPSGIRANALLPGIVEGPRMQKVIADRAAALELSYQDMEQDYLNKISLRRMVSAQDVAEQAIFLASPLGRNISGQAISICGNVETL